ncbi:MAG: response regulator transcription factor [Kordiimonadaceae bacterium]|nr:response regulator transcription factor [Kordiimonadaceae bacterium]
MNILIVEDEPRAANRLSDLLVKQVHNCTIVSIIQSVAEAVKWFKQHNMPDLILMDINLADGNCFSIFDLVQITAPIIFCTAFDEFALKAFQTNGIAYLLKPVSENDLNAALDKLDQLTKLQNNYKNIGLEKYKSRFLIQAGDKIFPVAADDIICFIMDEHGLKLYAQDDNSYFIDYTVSELDGLLNPDDFFRISRQAIIAKNTISNVTRFARNARIILKNGMMLNLSRDRTKPFRNWFEK